MSEDFRHLLNLETLSKERMLAILDLAKTLQNNNKENLKQILQGKTIVNLFFESSTRTRSSFEIAAKNLGATIVNFDIGSSSAKKGETLLDTINNLGAMNVDLFIIRHPSSGASEFVQKHMRSQIPIINAGDGCHEHPSQGLLDLYTIRQYKHDFTKLKIVIVGDILHSRVARSLIHGLNTLSASEIRVIGPKTLIPQTIEKLGTHVYYNLHHGIKDADVIIMLRLQRERMQGVYLPSETEYQRLYGLDQAKLALANEDAIIMHPGPINYNVEITPSVVESQQSVILNQVSNGVMVRMAIMTLLLNPRAMI